MDNKECKWRGELALSLTREALAVICDARQAGDVVVTMTENPYVQGSQSPVTPVDIAAQRVYANVLTQEDPSSDIVAEEKDPERAYPRVLPIRKRPVWLIDGLDGTSNFIENAPFGYGTQCALLMPDGTVPIAFVGDATSGAIFGYYGNSGVFQEDADGRRTFISDVKRELSLRKLPRLQRPKIHQYHPLSQYLLGSGLVGESLPMVGGIGTTMAMLLTDTIGLFALRPHHEQPWDAIPAYALCRQAGMFFMTPHADGDRFVPWLPYHLPITLMRKFDLLVVHESRVREFCAAAGKMT